MAVGSHLGIDVREYDARIRTFVPFYEEMLTVTAAFVNECAPRDARVVELGTGSGALAAHCLRRNPGLSFMGIDADPAMLEMAHARLDRTVRPAAERATGLRRSTREGILQLERGDFTRGLLPRCDVVMASLALHHIATRRRKLALYTSVAASLRPGGIFVSADCMPPRDRALAERGMRSWRAHLEQHYSPRQGRAYLESWSNEDHYETLEVELSLIERAGLVPDVIWRRDSFAVVAGTRRGRRVSRSRRA